jgi:hypothetical protein
VIFFYCSFHIVASYVITILSFISAHAALDLVRGIVWVMQGIPIVELIVSINLEIINSFFEKYCGVCGIIDFFSEKTEKAEDETDEFDEGKERCRKLVFYAFSLILIVMFALFVVLLITRDPKRFKAISLIVAVYCAIVPVSSFLRVLLYAWYPIVAPSRLDEAGEQSGAVDKSLVTCEQPAKQVEKNIPLMLFDAIELLPQENWWKFFCSDIHVFYRVRKGKWDLELLFAIGATGLQLLFIILDIVSVVVAKGSYGSLVLRVIVQIFAAPFIISVNLCIVFRTYKELAKNHERVKLVTIIGWVFLGICLLFFAIFGGLTAAFSPYIMNEVAPAPANLTLISKSQHGSVCGINVEGWSLLELAGLSMAAHNPTNLNVTETLLATVLSGDYNWSFTDVDARVPSIGVVRNSTPILAFQGAASSYELGIIFENMLITWFSMAMEEIVPFWGVASTVFLQPFFDWITPILQNQFVGAKQLSRSVFVESVNAVEQFQAQVGQLPLFTGHFSGGLISKSAAMEFGSWTIAFESLLYGSTAMALCTEEPNETGFRMLNVYSGSSFFSAAESDSIGLNIRLPDEQALWKPANPYETFCLIAAGCTDDDRFDNLCDEAIGRKKYVEYFEAWERSRQ